MDLPSSLVNEIEILEGAYVSDRSGQLLEGRVYLDKDTYRIFDYKT